MAKKKREAPKPREGELMPAVDPIVDMLEGSAFVISALPVLGGPISSVLSGLSAKRQQERIREVLNQVGRELVATQAEIREEYVRSDEFEDLLDQTLRRVMTERHESKRRLYAAFLAGAIKSPGEPYHEQLRFLRTVEELQPDHMRIIDAMAQAPPPGGGQGIAGSISQTLRRRLPDLPGDRLADLYGHLTDDLKLIVGSGFNTMMTAHGAEDLRNRVTPYGNRLLAYIRAAHAEDRG